MKRDYEKDENNEIDEKPGNFRLFRYFRLFRNLSSWFSEEAYYGFRHYLQT